MHFSVKGKFTLSKEDDPKLAFLIPGGTDVELTAFAEVFFTNHKKNNDLLFNLGLATDVSYGSDPQKSHFGLAVTLNKTPAGFGYSLFAEPNIDIISALNALRTKIGNTLGGVDDLLRDVANIIPSSTGLTASRWEGFAAR